MEWHPVSVYWVEFKGGLLLGLEMIFVEGVDFQYAYPLRL